MRIVSLASGSHGNAYVVEHDGASLLIDCGINFKTLAARLGASPHFDGVLVTHSHSDHVCGLPVLLKRFPELSVYANVMTAESVASELGVPDGSFVCFENGQSFGVSSFEILPFQVPHDTSDPVGFLVSAGGETYFHATDVGTPLDSIGARLAQADVATIESNHDPVMLRRSGRPERLVRRISGPRGHLSNDECCELVSRFASPRLKRLALAHLSGECNSPRVAMESMSAALCGMGRCDVSVKALLQDEAVEI